MKKLISESDLTSIICESVKRGINESFGVAHGAEALADYILKRCLNYKGTKVTQYLLRNVFNDEPVEPITAFTLTREQVVKNFEYPLPKNFKKLNIVCCDSKDFDAQLNTNFFEKKEFNLVIPVEYFVKDENYGYYKEILMHELTHFTNYNNNNLIGNIQVDEKNISTGAENFVNGILYLFQDTEMNARLTSFWYGLNRCLVLKREGSSYRIYSKRNKNKTILCENIPEVIFTLKHICNNQLNYDTMVDFYYYLMDEETTRDDITFGLDTFPSSPNDEQTVTNVYYAIIFGKSGFLSSSRSNGVFRLPSIKSIYGKREMVFRNHSEEGPLVYFKYEGEHNPQALERKYNDIRNCVRMQLEKTWKAFNKRADRIAYEWCMQQLSAKESSDKVV